MELGIKRLEECLVPRRSESVTHWTGAAGDNLKAHEADIEPHEDMLAIPLKN